jgi:hypothetical protein
MMERTLHRDFYFSDEIFRREAESIFSREWFCAGRDEEWPNSGDYQALDVLGESVLVVRTREGRLAAHYNVCRHRGSRLVPEGARGRRVDLENSDGLAAVLQGHGDHRAGVHPARGRAVHPRVHLGVVAVKDLM